ncbi:MAG TPA: hypothetical protein VJ828_11485 [Lacipirellulaceae bacterium]|nr:hypothetical protein [Lacipirellulaceae bacterium]
MKTFLTLSICGLAAFAASGLWGQVFEGEEDRPTVEATLELDKKPEPRRRETKVIVTGERAGGGGYGGREGGGRYGNPYGGMDAYGGRRGSYGRMEKGPKTVLKFQMAGDDLRAIREAAAALSEAEDDDARDEAQEKLSELLDEYFEADMNRREEELAAVEKRVKQLRELLERRREKKEDIINLQIDVLRNEADGLGFFSGDPAGGAENVFGLSLPPIPGAGLPPGHPQVPGVPPTPTAPAVAPVAVPVVRPE